MSMKTTHPEQYKKELDQWITCIQANIDACKKKGKTRYSIGYALHPVFIDDVREHFESLGYNTREHFFTEVVFEW